MKKKLLGIIGLLIILGMISGCVNETTNELQEKVTIEEPKINNDITEMEQSDEIKVEQEEVQVQKSELLTDEQRKLIIELALNKQPELFNVIVAINDNRINGGNKGIIVSYKSMAVSVSALSYETGLILGSFIGSIDQGMDVDVLLIIVKDINDDIIGTFHCTKEWKEAYYNELITMEELVLKVLSSAETTNDVIEEVQVQEPEPQDTSTLGEKNALSKAKSYLRYSAFSYDGLIKQLEFEGYSNEEAVYGVDNCGADWNEQAVKKAESYLKYSAFSREGLIEQLEFEGFTKEQAEYGVKAVGY